MVYMAIIALVAGILCGHFGGHIDIFNMLCDHSDIVLNFLMISVGISVGLQEDIFKKLKEYKWKAVIIPFGVMLASIIGGIICAIVLDYPMAEGTAIASCMGWYSLGGITIGAYSGELYGGIAFLANLLREIFAFFSIPFLSKRLNASACIAVAGATSEDTTLPMMIRYTSEEYIVLSVLNGFICSFFVPIIIPICYEIFR